jgi:opacity protein-like surface antigen
MMNIRKLTSRATVSIAAATALFASQAVFADAMEGGMDDMTMQLQQQILDMQRQLRDLEGRLAECCNQDSALDERVALLERRPVKMDSMIFFRGGYARNDTNRRNDLLVSVQQLVGTNSGKEGFYVGAGIEHQLTEDLFGLWDGANLWGEIIFDYKQFSRTNLNAIGQTVGTTLVATANNVPATLTNPLVVNPGAPGGTGLNVGPLQPVGSVTVTQFTLSASPKIKFMPDSKFQPWIIPIGFDIHVISPPSDGVTVLNAGVQFGAGAEYNVWKNMVVGIDSRYHYGFNNQVLSGVSTNGLTAGGYLGFKF